MPVIFSYRCHASSCRELFEYLDHDVRALGSDYLNCLEHDRRGRPCWQQMDVTRHALGYDIQPTGRGRRVSWLHLVVSPDPKDRVSLACLRDLTMALAKRHFADFQVAAFYHDDNERRIPHAHVCVNNARLSRPGHVTSDANCTWWALTLDLQRLAAERGLHAFNRKGVSVTADEWLRQRRQDEELGEAVHQTIRTKVRTRRTASDAGLERLGLSWKSEIRDRITCAVALSSTVDDFKGALETLGVSVREVEAASARDFLYTHKARASWKVLGAHLGRDWGAWGVCRRLRADERRGVPKPSPETRERLLATISALQAQSEAPTLLVLGCAGGEAVTARRVGSMLVACADHDIRSMDDFSVVLAGTLSQAERERVEDARALATALGHMPKARDAAEPPATPRRTRVPQGPSPAARVDEAYGTATACEPRVASRDELGL